ncbi:MAG: hypothetical protein Aurels2KO_00500 [Aureliella sp.]
MGDIRKPRITVGLLFKLTTFIAVLAAAVGARVAGEDEAVRSAAFLQFAMWTVLFVGSASSAVFLRSRTVFSVPNTEMFSSRAAAWLMIGMGVTFLAWAVHLTCSSSGLRFGWGLSSFGLASGVWAANLAHSRIPDEDDKAHTD